MLYRRLLLSIAFSVGITTAGNVSAQSLTINVDFNGKLFGAPGPTYSGQAGNPNAGTSWNGINFPGSGDESVATFTTAPLTASDGTTPTALTLTLNTPYNYYAESFGTNPNIASNAHDLMGDWIDGGGGGNSVVVNNLKPNTAYSFYLYGTGVDGANNPSGSSFTIDGVTQNTFNPGGGHVLTAGIDYTIFASVFSDANGNLEIDYTRHFAGLEFAEVTGVPELSTGVGAAIFLAGLAGNVARRRLTRGHSRTAR